MDTTQFETDFARALLQTEQGRALLLAAVLAAVSMLAGGTLFFAEQRGLWGIGAGEWRLPTFGIGVLALGELLVWRWLRGLSQRGALPPSWWRWLNVSGELLASTALLAIVATRLDVQLALVGPPSLLPMVFLFLTVLTLDPRLCLYAGALGAALHLAVWQSFVSEVPVAATIGINLYTPITAVIRTAGVFLLGGMSAAMARAIKARVLDTITADEKRREVMELFGQQVSPEVVNKLLEQPTGLESETRHICVMFLDIRDFTSFSEGRGPEAVVDYLNTLFDEMIASVNAHQGIINKFLGDGFMAVFGAPVSDGLDSQNAVAASRDLLARVERLVAEGHIPPTRIGIGLHAGAAVTGNIGSSLRREYTVIGDVVNTASRIEGLNKRFNSQLLISEEVYDNLEAPPPDAERLEPVPVKGRVEPVQIWKLA